MVVSFVRCADAFSADDSSAVTSLHNSLRKPDIELAKYLEFAEVNRALGKCTKSQRREELQSVLAVTDEALFLADTITSDRYKAHDHVHLRFRLTFNDVQKNILIIT